MPSTPNRGYTYPSDTDPATVPSDLAVPFAQIDADVQTLVDSKASKTELEDAIGSIEPLPAGDIPIFATMDLAEAWEAANPGRRALTIEPQTPDLSPPLPGTLTALPIDISAALTVSGASDDRGVTGYGFRVDNGAWSPWQEGPTYTMEGLFPSVPYTFQHRVRDKGGNVTLGTPVQATTTALGPKTPAQIGALWGHWDASSTGSLNDAGGAVSSWVDLTPAARAAVQNTPTQMPTISSIAGKTAVQFTKANQEFLRYLDPGSAMSTATGYTLCWVGQFNAALDTVSHGATGFSSGAKLGNLAAGSSAGTVGSLFQPAMIGPASQRPAPGEVIFAALVVREAGPSFAYVSGASGDPVSGGVGETTGSAFDIGRSDSGTYGSTTVGEVWAHNKPLTTGELDSLHLHARQKWGAK